MPQNKEVDAWLARYDNPMKPVVERIRAIVLAADPRIDECIKWRAPTFMYRGNLASFFPMSKQHASLMFHAGALIPGEHPLLEGGGDTGRVMKIGSLAEAESAKRDIERVVSAWCDWRDSAGESRTATHLQKRSRARVGTKSAKKSAKAGPRIRQERPRARRAGRPAKPKL